MHHATLAGVGRHDFDFELGSWRTQLRRLRGPLTGSTDWVEYEGTSIVTPLLGGRANVVALDVSGPAGRIEGMSLRLYRPETDDWSLNFVNALDGLLAVPAVGRFADGRGEFVSDEELGGRPIRSRFVVSDITADSCRFEQAFSDDGGATWESNWIAVDTRIG